MVEEDFELQFRIQHLIYAAEATGKYDEPVLVDALKWHADELERYVNSIRAKPSKQPKS